MRPDPSKPWFAPKRYGYGAGLPIAWQGWAVLIVYILIISGAAYPLVKLCPNTVSFLIAYLALSLVATVILGVICARTTRGGWRWRNGDDD